MIKIEKKNNGEKKYSENKDNKEIKEEGLTVEFNFKRKAKELKNGLDVIVRKSNFILFFAMIFLIISASLEVLLMFRVKDITDLAFLGNVDAVKGKIYEAGILLLLLIPILIINSKFLALYMEKSMINLKSYFLENMLRSSQTYRERDKVSKYLSSLTNNISIVQTKYFASRYNFLSGLVHVVAGIVLALALDWRIIIFSIGIALIILVGVMGMSNAITGILNRLTNSHEEYTGKLREAFSGIHIIKTNDLEEKIINEFRVDSNKIQSEQAAFQKVQINVNAYIQLVVSLFLFAFLLFIIRFVWKGTYTPGEIIYLLTSFSFVLFPGLSLFMNGPDLKAGKEALLELEKIFSEKSPEEGVEIFDSNCKYIYLKNFSFSYDDEELITNLNMDLELGRKYLIVGPSGVGKSTFVRLLKKELKANSGDIEFDDISISRISKKSLLEHIAYMGQSVFLFEDSIENNIKLYKEYSSEELNNAIDKAKLTSFIDKQEDGIKSFIYDDGKNISGGEKSRIALARVIIRQAKILFLDEPFANLDSKTGSEIEKRILDLKDITVFNISHVVFRENLREYDFVLVFSKNGVEKISPEEYEKIMS